MTGPEQQTELTRSTTQPEQLGVDPILLYDGACGFCTASVQFILAHERQQSLRFASLQGAMASAIRATHPKLTEVDSIVWLESSGKGDAKLWFRSAAALRVAWYMGGLWRFAAIGYLVPAALRDRLYAYRRDERTVVRDIKSARCPAGRYHIPNVATDDEGAGLRRSGAGHALSRCHAS